MNRHQNIDHRVTDTKVNRGAFCPRLWKFAGRLLQRLDLFRRINVDLEMGRSFRKHGRVAPVWQSVYLVNVVTLHINGMVMSYFEMNFIHRRQ